MNLVRLAPTLVVKYLVIIIYKVICLFLKVKPNKITFASYRAEELSGNLYSVWNEINLNYPQYDCHFALKKFHSSFLGKFDYVVHMVKATYHLATSAYFIIDDFYLPAYMIKVRKNTEIIQLWHAAGALKKFGYSTVGKSFGPSIDYLKHVKIHSNYSSVFVSSSEVIPYYAEAFNIPSERIYPFGTPRTDTFFSASFKKITESNFYKEYPELRNKKIILYAPTYRGKSHYQADYVSPIDFEKMEKELKDDGYALVVHLHPYMKPGTDLIGQSGDFLYHVRQNFHIQELLIMTDILITDYSTVFFDFSLLERPIVFFADDIEDYVEQRDFYYDYQDLIPGPLFSKTNQLTECIKSKRFDLGKVKTFKDRFFDYQDGKSTERIVQFILRK
ncbi:CDP-glycerol glycerophosphotransferase family protein [Aquibacillus saliphilus]|uniref:CDP-glycerol glycerophosphotransferase family protein n=1 Tax=Aquibacillus saliphilus TaxID=1909422 RepID=UPI001CF046D2|nr:CDP-glycerol glycerophosphotransferase family protein [Aquibacillus saliphilus]